MKRATGSYRQRGYGLDITTIRVAARGAKHRANVSMARLNRMIADAKATGMHQTLRELLRLKAWKLKGIR
jgi:hypothetical protein